MTTQTLECGCIVAERREGWGATIARCAAHTLAGRHWGHRVRLTNDCRGNEWLHCQDCGVPVPEVAEEEWGPDSATQQLERGPR